MNQLIGCCGLDCEACNARIATVTNDSALREKTAALWTELNGVPITPEIIHCTGCRVEGPKTPFCDKLCPVHTASGRRSWTPAPTVRSGRAAPRWAASPPIRRRCWTA